MYHYFQRAERSAWEVAPSKPGLLHELAKDGAKKCSILAVSEQIGEDTERGDLRYKGPLYFDIDCGGDLDQAASSMRELVDRLQHYGVERTAIQVYASGSKGFHVVVPAAVFSTGRPTKNLPKVYAGMARELYVPGMDFAVYAGGRGNTFRIPNVQREDGRYRVPLLPHETATVNAANYLDLVSAPRDRADYLQEQETKALPLQALFEKHRKLAKTVEQVVKPVADADLTQFQESPPACIERIAAGRTKQGAVLNQVAMQFGIFTARAGVPVQIWKPLASRAAEALESHTYDTAPKRREHLEAQVKYAQYAKRMQFSCFAMRSVVGMEPCDGCPLHEASNPDADAGLDLGIEERDDGYYLLGNESDRKISNFILVPANECIEHGQADGRWRRVGTQMDIVRNGDVLSTVMFHEHSWSSKSHFVHEVEGFKDLSFVGSDADVQRIKTVVYREGREMGEIVRVYAAGIHAHKVLGRTVMVYVEPGFSMNSLRIAGTHELQGTVQVAPKLAPVKLPKPGEDLGQISEALSCLLGINSPGKVAQLVGYFAACHLRTHFQRIWNQFPVLSIWGAAGSGKTSQATLGAWLCGADYIMENSPLNLSSVTPWALIDYCSTSTTIPRLLDEFNKSKMDRKSYNLATEIIKASWGTQTIARGRVGSAGANGAGRTGAVTTAIPISAPLVILGEQAPDIPAIQQRSLQVLLTREGRLECTAAYERATALREHLLPLAKAMMLQALSLDPDWIVERMKMYESVVPADMMERPRYSYRVVLVGLDFLERAVRALGLDDAILGQLGELKRALHETLKVEAKVIAREKSWSEIDSVLATIAEMTALAKDGAGGMSILPKYVATKGSSLYLDVPVVFAIYKRSAGQSVVIESLSTFQQLLANEPYFVTDKARVPAMAQQRTVVELDLEQMAEKGHIVSLFA